MAAVSASTVVVAAVPPLCRLVLEQLCGPLIKLFRLFGQLDGEEGLHAGVEVESFTCPAGSDGLGGWMLEDVHRS
jgi:hypothetical protein